MNSKWYWLIRQKCRNLKFQIKKAAFRLNERKESSERLSSFSRIVIRTLLVQVAINLVFLDYMLQKLNNGFEPLRQEFGFVGRIITPLPRINYNQHLAEYHDGRINASQLGDIILKKNLRN